LRSNKTLRKMVWIALAFIDFFGRFEFKLSSNIICPSIQSQEPRKVECLRLDVLRIQLRVTLMIVWESPELLIILSTLTNLDELGCKKLLDF
jgi:hypothetical protein